MKIKEEINANRRKNYLKNKQKILLQNKKWRDKHKDEINLRRKPYFESHRKEAIERSKKYYYENKSKINEKNNARYKQNRIAISNYGQRPEVKARKKELKKINIDRTRELRRNNYKKNKEKEIARAIARLYIEIKPCCEICGSTNNLERHHWRYDKPLMVNTLCEDCHDIQHTKDFYGSKFGEIKNAI